MHQFGTGYKNTNQRDIFTREKIKEYIIDETAIKSGSEPL